MLINPMAFVLIELGLVKRDNELRQAAQANADNADNTDKRDNTDKPDNVDKPDKPDKPASQEAGTVRLLPILLRVARNPIVFMTVFGLIGNLAFGGKAPEFVDKFLGTLGSAFTAGALTNLGGSMVGKTRGDKEARRLLERKQADHDSPCMQAGSKAWVARLCWRP